MSNMLRGSLTSTTDAKGGLGFKGERGYSNYEIYVKNGGTMTEQEWLDHFGVDLTDYAKTTEVDTKDDAIKADIGDLEELTTVDKTSTVDAINELNTNINSLDDRDSYSTTEQVIGTWIDGKPIYRKVIYISSLPNATQNSYNTGVSNPEQCVNCYGFATSGLALNVVRPLNVSSSLGCWYDITSNQVKVEAGTDRSNLSAYVIIEYTKTTD